MNISYFFENFGIEDCRKIKRKQKLYIDDASVSRALKDLSGRLENLAPVMADISERIRDDVSDSEKTEKLFHYFLTSQMISSTKTVTMFFIIRSLFLSCISKLYQYSLLEKKFP